MWSFTTLTVVKYQWKKVKVTLSCLTLCNPMDYTVQGILQARILEWVAYPFSSRSSWPRNWTGVSCIAGRIVTNWACSFHFSSVAQSFPTLCDPMNCKTPGPVHQQFPESTQTHVHWVGNAIQPFHPLSSLSPAFSLPQHQGLFQWMGSLHQVAKGLELQLQHQSFQWIFRSDFL